MPFKVKDLVISLSEKKPAAVEHTDSCPPPSYRPPGPDPGLPDTGTPDPFKGCPPPSRIFPGPPRGGICPPPSHMCLTPAVPFYCYYSYPNTGPVGFVENTILCGSPEQSLDALALLKGQLLKQLAEVEKEKEKLEHHLAPKTVEDVDLLSGKLTEALDHLKARRAELSKETPSKAAKKAAKKVSAKK